MISIKSELTIFYLTEEGALRLHGIYRHACPNCKGSIDDLRLLYKAPCDKCLPSEEFIKLVKELEPSVPRIEVFKKYIQLIRRDGELKKLLEEEEELKNFEEFFEIVTKGYKMWSAQRTWAKRYLQRQSFSIIAPTGTGKTVFSLIAALYRSLKIRSEGRKIYLAFPTTPLLLQAWRKLLKFAENAGIEVCTINNWNNKCLRVICVHSKLGNKEREFYINKIRNGDFDILLTTSAFIHKHESILPRGKYDLVIMDDVDAILRSGRAVRRLLAILGLKNEDIDRGLELIKLRSKLATLPQVEIEKIRPNIEMLDKEIEEAKKILGDTVLIVNSATGRPRGIYSKLFRVFMNFEAGSKPEVIRNIVDSFIEPGPRPFEEVVLELVKKLRDGLLIFVPVDKGVEYAEYIAKILKDNGFNAEAFHAKKQVDLIEKFSRGEIDILVGVATYYGVMVRGIDLPERVKFILFIGVPRHKFSPRLETISPIDILRMLTIIREVLSGEEKEKVDLLIGRISRRLKTMSQGALAVLREKFTQALQRGTKEETPLIRDLLVAYEVIRENLGKPEILSKLSNLGEVGIAVENGDIYILVPDVATYIQASGRCSRLYPGGITRGLSIIIVDDVRLFNGLTKRLKWIFEGFKIYKLEEVNLDELIVDINKEREEVRRILAGEIIPEKQLELVKTALLIVESPNKARTIANFFGKPSIRVLGKGVKVYEITIGNYILNIVATGGHIYDLVVDSKPCEADSLSHLYGVLVVDKVGRQGFIPIYTDIKRCLNGHQFTDETDNCPKCQAPVLSAQRKLNIIEVLRKLASEVDIVLIGTDPDAEGEKIAWDLRVLLEPYAEKIRRVEFHEVTRRAIVNAILNPRDFDYKLVEAQIVRRMEDRWLGFSLSEIVQKYAWPEYCFNYLYQKRKLDSVDICCRPNRNLSAGRVQTPVLGFVIEEYGKSKNPEHARYILYIELEKGLSFQVTLNYCDISKLEVYNERGKVKEYPNVKIVVLDEYEEDVNPPPPFTTDTLLEEASRQLGFSTTKTMDLAQDLFEMGFITYHRTDSTRVSDTGVEVAKQYIEEKYGYKGVSEVFRPRTWAIGGAHEAVRPTRPIDADHLSELIREGVITVIGRVTRDHMRLYDLIFRRFIASQMKPAKVKKQKLKIELSTDVKTHELQRDVISFIVDKGYLEVYENIQVELTRLGDPGTTIWGYVKNIRRINYPLPRFHDVIRWMKDKGIGRPSTYAKIVQTLIDRRYVTISKTRKALVVQERGKKIYEFLYKHFKDLVNESKTRDLEEKMDKVERGEIFYQKVLAEIYKEVVENVLNEAVEKKILGESIIPVECLEYLSKWRKIYE